jgi:hypothetical protein
MPRKSHSREFWQAECDYIQSVVDSWPQLGYPFRVSDSNDKQAIECFHSYALMQSRFAREDGFKDLADLILEARSVTL